jgi:hypothetical protein
MVEEEEKEEEKEAYHVCSSDLHSSDSSIPSATASASACAAASATERVPQPHYREMITWSSLIEKDQCSICADLLAGNAAMHADS